MLPILLLITSICIQLLAAYIALRLLKVTGFTLAWILIASAQVLMALRRSATLYDIVHDSSQISFHLPSELLALTISVLMLTGIILVRPMIVASNRNQKNLAESEKIYRDILDNMTETYYRTDANGAIIMASHSAEALMGYPMDEILGRKLSDFYVHAEDRDVFLAKLQKEKHLEGHESLLSRADGQHVYVETNARMIIDATGQFIGVEGIARDTSRRKQTEQVNLRLGRIIEDSANEIYVFGRDTLVFNLVNRGARENLGYSSDELMQMTPLDIKPGYTSESFAETIKPLLEGETQNIELKTIHKRKDGSTYPVKISLQLARTESPQLFVAIVEDLTEKLAAEEQLSQAQKMETVGQLTGGIAHDFNNLLTVVMGNIELALSQDLSADIRQRLSAALEAGQRGATLTQRLLAFSRKQPLEPEILDLRKLIGDVTDLLQRTLREDIDIEIASSDSLWLCEADPTQLENVLLNLAINARDAMPDGGKLTIETSNAVLDEEFSLSQIGVKAGQYVLVEVSDTGEGMAEATVSRVFDPFFTTKPEGKGSGLGLSMVYGFVKQSGGYIDVYSEPDVGTTIKIYLPKSHEGSSVDYPKLGKQPETLGNGQRILVVEDNMKLGNVIVEMLQALNYFPLYASTYESAVSLLEAEKGNVALLLTDVILTGTFSGKDLATLVESRWPEIGILYMSGYTENAIIHEGRLDPDVRLLAKPFTKKQMSLKVSQVLDLPHIGQ